ncbi:DUF5082 family protein [Virgibacillus halodenitrificans]|uniref:YwqH-like family protein n=1 Tax=Virgibacillus halodenitrificans TaxID=1482 RepID=UPI001F381069|nr:DUF5082 family protein [Virgibacillus halodenitrificans]MCG1029668.1 DUF5082 family protein [Virgibacillus halodenitrificans]
MADDADFLSQAFAVISGRSADIEEKIDRLTKAKNDIREEQASSMMEITKITKPTLEGVWSGNCATNFDDDREDALEIMEKITDDYDDYIQRIENEIFQLNLQKGALDIASSIAHQADNLLDKGEEVAAELGDKIRDLKGRLFS